MNKWIVLFTLAAMMLAGCAPAPQAAQIEIQDAWVRAAPAMLTESGSGMGGMHGGNTSAAYMVIRNVGREDDALIAVASDAAEIVEMHTTQTKNGVSMMSAVDTIPVPGRGKAELKPGALHIMMIKIKHDLVAGEKVTLVLTFEKFGEVTVEAEIREP